MSSTSRKILRPRADIPGTGLRRRIKLISRSRRSQSHSDSLPRRAILQPFASPRVPTGAMLLNLDLRYASPPHIKW
jgi:hypothetical protein